MVKAKPLEQEKAKLSGLVAKMNDKIGKLESTIARTTSLARSTVEVVLLAPPEYHTKIFSSPLLFTASLLAVS